MKVFIQNLVFVLIISALTTAQGYSECSMKGGVCEPFFNGALCKSGEKLPFSCGRLGAMCCKPQGFPTECELVGGVCRQDVSLSICADGRLPHYCFGTGTVCCRT